MCIPPRVYVANHKKRGFENTLNSIFIFRLATLLMVLIKMNVTIAWRRHLGRFIPGKGVRFFPHQRLMRNDELWMKYYLVKSLHIERNRDGSRVCRSDNTLLKSVSAADESESSNWKRFSQVKREMAFCIETEDFETAKSLYEEIRDTVHQHGNIDTVLMFLSICHKASQRITVENVIRDLQHHEITISEQVYFALIRCYCDGNLIQHAWDIIRAMEQLGVEPRLRTFLPILEACERTGDINTAFKIFDYFSKVPLQPRSEQLTILLTTLANYCKKSSNNDHDGEVNILTIKGKVDDILKQSTSHLIGFPTEELERIAAAFTNCTNDQLRNCGVLVENFDDIDGPIISDNGLQIDGSVVALNATYNSSSRLWDQYSPSPNHPHPPLGLKVEGLHFVPQKFVVWSEKSSKFMLKPNSKTPQDHQSIWDTKHDPSSDNSDHQFAAPKGNAAMYLRNPDEEKEMHLPARLVHISDKTCRCPHCHTVIMNIPISDSEKREVREALIRTASEQSLTHISHLEAFAQWLQSRPEYDYIIDGPNVAYQNQNHFYGRFSYRQIELVVNKLTAMGKRPLVILPSIYSRGNFMIRNSIRRSGAVKKILLTDSEKEFLERLEKEDMLYAVPRGANDDWYWMYSTLYPGRKSQAFVVSNDLMRDHKVSFLAPSSFIRWRSSQIVYYSIFRNYNQFMWSNPPGNTTLPGIVDVDNELFLHQSTPNSSETSVPTLNDMKIDGEVEFFGPGNFSREIQQSGSGRWHIPALGSNLWLCLNT